MIEQEDFPDDSTTEKAERIAWLIAGYLRQSLTPPEHNELDEWVGESDANMKIFEELTDEKKLKEGLDWLKQVNKPQMLKRVKAQLVFKRGPIPIFHYLAAACFLTLICLSGYLIYKNNTRGPNNIAEIVNQHQDLQPGRQDKAILTLGDGTTIQLDNAKDGKLATQGSSDVVKENGKLIYNQGSVGQTVDLTYNTVAIPRGGDYKMTLSDGTNVWLNSASSIKFPPVFAGKERKVSIKGEVYFEVAKNKAMPFIVNVEDKNISVQVLGTHFNINAYNEESAVKTTLLEGSVKVIKLNANDLNMPPETSFIKPGEQAEVADKIKINKSVNIDEVMAWQNGMFRFNDASIKRVMDQVSRWYDVDIVYQGPVTTTTYNCLLKRSIPASKLFATLEQTGGVHFRIDGRKVYVLP